MILSTALLFAVSACATVAQQADNVALRANGLLGRLPGAGGPPVASGPAGGQFPNQQFGGGVAPQQTTLFGPAPPAPQLQQAQPALPTQPAPQVAALQQPVVFRQASFGQGGQRQLSSAPISATQAQIADVQIKLYSLNINPGPPNGILGLETANAIAFFQRRIGMRVDGAISEMLVYQLESTIRQDLDSRRLR